MSDDKSQSIFIKQPPFRYCGQCQLKVISEYIYKNNGIDFSDKSFLDYSPNRWAKITGFINTYTMSRAIFKSNFDTNRIDNINNIEDFVNNIKKEIDNNKIIIMSMGHWYLWHKNKFNAIKWIFFQHYVSIWSYDENGVYIYDSSCYDDIEYKYGNLYISWEIFYKSYQFAISKMILSISKNIDYTDDKISCVVPVYNEKDRIKGVISALQKVPNITEIICVDDGSVDVDYETYVWNMDKVTVIKKKNEWKSDAIKIWFQNAKNKHVFFCDADLHDINNIDIFLWIQKYLNQEMDMLIFRRKNSKWWLKFLKLDILISWERVLNKEFANLVFDQNPKNFEFDLMSNIVANMHKKKVWWVFSNWTNTYKFQKMWFLRWIIEDIKMYKDIWIIKNKMLKQIYDFDDKY